MAYIDNIPARCMLVDAPALDPIVSVWLNDGGGKGRVILQCYGDAWTAYWGAMGLRTLEEFFIYCDVEYLTARFRPKKKDDAYLKRIVTAVRESMKQVLIDER